MSFRIGKNKIDIRNLLSINVGSIASIGHLFFIKQVQLYLPCNKLFMAQRLLLKQLGRNAAGSQDAAPAVISLAGGRS